MESPMESQGMTRGALGVTRVQKTRGLGTRGLRIRGLLDFRYGEAGQARGSISNSKS